MTARNAIDEGVLKSTGQQLQQARLQQNLQLEHISQALRVNRGILKALEEDDYSQPLGQGYWRGHLRRYAEYLQLDPRPLIVHLEQEGILTAIGLKQTERLGVFSRGRKAPGFRSPRLMLLALCLALVAWFWVGPGQETMKQLLTDTPLAFLQEYFPDVGPKVHPARTELELAPVPVSVNETTLSLPPRQKALVVGPEKPSSAAEEASSSPLAGEAYEPLQLSFKAECWVTVVDKYGKTLVNGLKQAGETVELVGSPPFKLVLGNVEHVAITKAGKPVDLSSYQGQTVVRLTLE